MANNNKLENTINEIIDDRMSRKISWMELRSRLLFIFSTQQEELISSFRKIIGKDEIEPKHGLCNTELHPDSWSWYCNTHHKKITDKEVGVWQYHRNRLRAEQRKALENLRKEGK